MKQINRLLLLGLLLLTSCTGQRLAVQEQVSPPLESVVLDSPTYYVPDSLKNQLK